MVGFSVGMALLLAAAFIGYRQLALPWQSRIGGFVMLAGLALIQLAHLGFAPAMVDPAASLRGSPKMKPC